MATYQSNIWNTKISSDGWVGNTGIISGKVVIPATTGIATSDIINLFRLRAGHTILAFHGESSAWGTAVPGTLGHYGVDDDAAIDADSVIADVDLEDADVFLTFATPLQAQAACTEDATVRIVVGTVSTPEVAAVKYLYFSALIAYYGSGTDATTPVYTWNGNASGRLATE